MTSHAQGVRSARLRVSRALVLALWLAACEGASPPSAKRAVTVVDLPSPAGPGAQEPNLSPTEDGAVLSWLEPEGDSWSLKTTPMGPAGWGETRTVVTRGDLFVNWADVPSVVRLSDGRLAAHWLQRGDEGGYDYGIRVVFSDDDGAHWSDPWTPHEDDTATEHGFVTLAPGDDGRLTLLWLDGRRFADGPAGPATEEMSLRARVVDAGGEAGPEMLVDGRTCDCCQTAMARVEDGWVAVYRDRADDEVRDIFASRFVDGTWTEPRPVHRDGWTIDACPVNGPAADALGQHVAVAWFTAAADVRRVEVAFSDDGGVRFSEPVRVDDGDPVGRVDVVLAADGAALVTWVERTDDGADVRLRRVAPGGALSDAAVLALTSEARAAGFPHVVPLPDGDLLAAWTDVSGEGTRVRTARIRFGGVGER